jgi:transcriptional regulator with XRE-family HTH domain
MSQERLADECGVERTHISNVEHDRATPSLGLLAKIVRALGADANPIVREAGR